MQPIFVTFDNGPEPDATPDVLDILARRGITTSFFVIGDKLREPRRRALAERARAEGHQVGNHTLTHGVPLGRRGGTEAMDEIATCDELLGPLREPARLFRPNGGGGALGPHLLNTSAARHLQQGGHTVVLWNSVPGDFDDPEGWPDRALAQHAAASAPVLMVLHDLPNGAMSAPRSRAGRLRRPRRRVPRRTRPRRAYRCARANRGQVSRTSSRRTRHPDMVPSLRSRPARARLDRCPCCSRPR